jgi:hypothetical protein
MIKTSRMHTAKKEIQKRENENEDHVVVMKHSQKQHSKQCAGVVVA